MGGACSPRLRNFEIQSDFKTFFLVNRPIQLDWHQCGVLWKETMEGKQSI